MAAWQERTEECDRRAAARTDAVKVRWDARALPLPRLGVGTYARIQDPVTKRWDKVAMVMGIGRTRDYLLRTPSGRVLWRNRRFLRGIPLPPDVLSASCAESPDRTQVTDRRPAETPHGCTRRRRGGMSPVRRSARIASRS